ncbi:MAG TPA: GAF domain-containing protein [Cyclobacteriaceae bacterium]|nr:GAF domain-containing protein [Cyclobacteriaceae bacterium]
MRNYFLGLKIRIKLLAAFGSILLLSILLIALSITSIDRIIRYKKTDEQVDALKLRLETLDLASREFMYEGYKSKSFLEEQKTTSIENFNTAYTEVKDIIAHVKQNEFAPAESVYTTTQLSVNIDSLQKDFRSLVELLKKRGFKDYGLEGSLRTAIHKVENSGFDFDKVTMLMLRRHEKDFFLRKDLKYQDEFNKRFESFRQQLEATSNSELISFVDNYRKEFNAVVDIEKKIGLTETEGLRGRIKHHFIKIHPQIEEIRVSMKDKNETQISNTKLVLWIIFFIQIITGIVMALVYAGLLTKSIKEIRGGMQKLANGIFPEKFLIRSNEEIGQTKLAFNQFIDRLETATDFAENLGSGNLSVQYNEQYSNDVLAKSLVNAQDKLRNAEERQRKINWINEGAAQFNDILKNDTEEIESMGDSIVKLLVNYIGGNQGVLYVLHGPKHDNYLKRIATYAYEKKKFIDDRIEIGTGLIGQCFLEAETIYLKDIPKDFVKITSGLGAATPRNVIIVPLKIRNLVMGVLELASFEVMETYQIEFVERMAGHIATILSNKQTATETKHLLEESQQRAHTLTQQEEEMRQNAEELQATQDEMERQRHELQQEIKQLKHQLAKALEEKHITMKEALLN